MLADAGDRLLAAQEHALGVHRHHLVPFGFRHRLDAGDGDDAGILHRDGEGAEFRLGFAIGVPDGLRVGDVEGKADHLGPGFLSQCFGGSSRILFDRGDGDLRTFFRKALGDAAPDALVASGDEYRLACETFHGLFSIMRRPAED